MCKKKVKKNGMKLKSIGGIRNEMKTDQVILGSSFEPSFVCVVWSLCFSSFLVLVLYTYFVCVSLSTGI